MWVCTSIMPGMTVYGPRSITSAPAGGAAVPTETMRASVTTMTAFAIVLPFGSIALPARIAFVAANAGMATSTIANVIVGVAGADLGRSEGLRRELRRWGLVIERSRFLDLAGDFACEPLR